MMIRTAVDAGIAPSTIPAKVSQYHSTGSTVQSHTTALSLANTVVLCSLPSTHRLYARANMGRIVVGRLPMSALIVRPNSELLKIGKNVRAVARIASGIG